MRETLLTLTGVPGSVTPICLYRELSNAATPPFGRKCPPRNLLPREPVPPQRRPGPPLYEQLRTMLGEAWQRHRSRVRLADLDDRMLKDIGITRAEAEFEANKPFWWP